MVGFLRDGYAADLNPVERSTGWSSERCRAFVSFSSTNETEAPFFTRETDTTVTLSRRLAGDVAEVGPDCELEKGKHVIYNKFGIGTTDIEMNGDSYVIIKEADLIGSFPGSSATANDIPKMTPLVRRGDWRT